MWQIARRRSPLAVDMHDGVCSSIANAGRHASRGLWIGSKPPSGIRHFPRLTKRFLYSRSDWIGGAESHSNPSPDKKYLLALPYPSSPRPSSTPHPTMSNYRRVSVIHRPLSQNSAVQGVASVLTKPSVWRLSPMHWAILASYLSPLDERSLTPPAGRRFSQRPSVRALHPERNHDGLHGITCARRRAVLRFALRQSRRAHLGD